MTHYDEESLFQYAEGTSPIAGEIAAHVSDCTECGEELRSHREIVDALESEDAWDEKPEPAPKPMPADVFAFAERLKQEDVRAAQICDEALTGPPSWWPARLLQLEGVRCAGMVRQLLDRMRHFLETSPTKALQVTTLAIELANELDVIEYPNDFVIRLRAQALRDHAYVLSFMGRFPEALKTAERSQQLFDQVPLPEYEVARLNLVRASILRATDRGDEAIALAREAAETFLRFGDRTRYVNALITEAAFLYDKGAISDALQLWRSIENDPALESVSRIRIITNIANCYRQLRQAEKAIEYLIQSSAEFEMLGMKTERTRSRWSLAQCLAAANRHQESIPVFRQAWREFDELEMMSDAALCALELTEALLIIGDSAEVPAICRELVARFTRAGMTSRAMNALSFLREAVAIGQAQPSLVRHVCDFLRELPAERPRLYAPPPAGRLEE
ncbi:MAG TPA: tetratricopeptide repeat protein [Thermoanaerobaculia bacterium]|nr:tetratricopeptide repeat protein [Thermoanaerobaculia bacterium]